MLEEIHHFGVTVHEQRRSRDFYARALRLPWMAESVNSGERYDRIYELEEAVNRITWYQIGRGGMETLNLPRHPSRAAGAGDIRQPGFRYIAFRVDGFDDYIEHLSKAGLHADVVETRDGLCARVQDPDGIHVLLFDTGRVALAGHVSGLKEIGLVAARRDEYEQFFDTLGLWLLERDCDFLEELFGVSAPAPLYGHVRLISPHGIEDDSREQSHCIKPAHSPRAAFSDIGIKHIAYSVGDAGEFYARGREAGLTFLFEPVNVPGGSRITYFLDPEGNTFEAMQLNPAMRIAAHAAGALTQARISLFARANGLLRTR